MVQIINGLSQRSEMHCVNIFLPEKEQRRKERKMRKELLIRGQLIKDINIKYLLSSNQHSRIKGLLCNIRHDRIQGTAHVLTANKPKSSPMRTSADNYADKCRYCQQKHWRDECTKYRTISERKQQLKDSCFKCLKIGHEARRKMCLYHLMKWYLCRQQPRI
ncbi:hypothetical protein DPMN_145730 [Dreissena polymorpha]|uniref:Uncharacterized protein n=1 Tax=Dreissena polymorpha TaxID=45954 RepID=A0A9D4F6M2_DREPO|nr:hypothetical protein DPMN_145730 [Dreissena polymorpha]